MSSILSKSYIVKMPDSSRWSVYIRFIAENCARYYSIKEDRQFEEVLKEVEKLFEENEYEIRDWAQNNMDWEDIEHVAEMISSPDIDYQEGWVNGECSIE